MKTTARKARPETTNQGSAKSIGSRKGIVADAGLRSYGADNLNSLAGMIDSSTQVQQYTDVQKQIDESPYAAVQMKQHNIMFGAQPLQRQEEEELQGKFEQPVQRQEEEELQGKFEPVQRQEEEELQGKFEPVQRQEEEELQGKFITSTPVQLKEGPETPANKTGMPDQLKSGLENISGMDMSDVRVHYNSPKPAQLSALAYTQGTDIHVAPGQERHLPHEGWHAVQQKQDRVQPTTQMEGTPVNDNSGLEKEADVMGGKAVQMKGASFEQSGCLQMVPWVVGQTTVAGALSPSLNAGYLLASGSPNVKPARPAWVDARVALDNPWNVVTERTASEQLAHRIWRGLPPNAKNRRNGSDFRRDIADRNYNNRRAVYLTQLPLTAAAKWLTAKWNDGWNNTDGFLPGAVGAGGYAEYYAEPTGVIGAEGFWGRNRIVRDTAGLNANYWWATSDHYNNFTRIT